MSILGKMQFWKKDDDLDFDMPSDKPHLGLPDDNNLGLPRTENTSDGLPKMPSDDPMQSMDRSFQPPKDPFSNPQQTSMNQGYQAPSQITPLPAADHDMKVVSKDLEVISAKLDSLKMSMENINQRVMRIEKIAERELEKSLEHEKAHW